MTQSTTIACILSHACRPAFPTDQLLSVRAFNSRSSCLYIWVSIPDSACLQHSSVLTESFWHPCLRLQLVNCRSNRKQLCPSELQVHLARLLLCRGAAKLLRQRSYSGRAGDGLSNWLCLSACQGLAEPSAELQSAPGALRICGAAQMQGMSDHHLRDILVLLLQHVVPVVIEICCARSGSYHDSRSEGNVMLMTGDLHAAKLCLPHVTPS